MLAMFLGTDPLFEEPAIGFLDVLDLCGVLVLGACRKPTKRGSNSDGLCDLCPTAFRSVCIDQTTAPRCACATARDRKFKNPCWSQLVFDSQDVCCTLTADYAGSHGVAGCHAWHDRSIRDAKTVDAVDFKVAMHHTHGLPPHFGRG